jgi:multicomponent Na+:H+ antiporter subunit A
VAAAALTFGYIGRFWIGLFLGPRRAVPHPIPSLLIAPIVVLAATSILGGVFVEPFARLAADAATDSHGATVALEPAYHIDARPENLMALAAWALGGLILAAPRSWAPAVRALAAAGDHLGPRRTYAALLAALNRVSDVLHGVEVRDLRNSIAAVLVPGGVLAALGFAATPTAGAYEVGAVSRSDALIIAVLAVAAIAALAVARSHSHLHAVLSLSVVGFGLAAVYGFVGAPDVALVAVVVETVVTLVFLAALARLPRAGGGVGIVPGDVPRSRRWRDPLVGVIAGVAAFATIWGFLSRPSVAPSVAAEQIRLAPEAYGKAVVTVILADFRGLDTLAEVTVLAIAVVGVATLLQRGRLW